MATTQFNQQSAIQTIVGYLGSTTAYLNQLEPHGSNAVSVLSEGLRPLHQAELGLLSGQPGELGWCREVALTHQGQWLIYAKTLVAQSHLVGPLAQLKALGTQYLGEILFQQLKLPRCLLELVPYLQASDQIKIPKNFPNEFLIQSWLRRSLFCVEGSSVYLTEVFFPNLFEIVQQQGGLEQFV